MKPQSSSKVWLLLNIFCGEHLVVTSSSKGFVGRLVEGYLREVEGLTCMRHSGD